MRNSISKHIVQKQCILSSTQIVQKHYSKAVNQIHKNISSKAINAKIQTIELKQAKGVQLRLGLFLDQFHHLFHHPVCFFCLLLHFPFEFVITSYEILLSDSGFFQFCCYRDLVFKQ